MLKKFKCDVDPKTDFLEIDTIGLGERHTDTVFIEVVNGVSGDEPESCIAVLSRSDARALAEHILSRLDETKE